MPNAFPLDDTETEDSDGDGVGDNTDAFPLDPAETTDNDGDGIGDNAATDGEARASIDSEMLELLISLAATLDSDGDGVFDRDDEFPFDETESVDTDGDGVGDNADGAPLGEEEPVVCDAGSFGLYECKLAPVGTYVEEAGALTPTLCSPGTYTDEEGSTSCKTSDSGFFVGSSGASAQTACPAGTNSDSGSTSSSDCRSTTNDADGDSRPDASDNCPLVANANQSDHDNDQRGDSCDIDDDDDGIPDTVDSHPFNASISVVSVDGVDIAASPKHTVPSKVAFGEISDSFSVDGMGGLNYSIPLPFPAAPGGITPQMSLDYNSNLGNGLAGIGWSLEGISSITRCGSSYAKDGQHQTVKYDNKDNYCYNGQRLIEIGTYAGNVLYETENKSYNRIVSKGASDFGPTSWEITNQKGVVYRYGETIGGQQAENSGAINVVSSSGVRLPLIHTWSLSNVVDPIGNNYTIDYFESLEGSDVINPNGSSQFFPRFVRYGGSNATKIQVEFVYHDQDALYKDVEDRAYRHVTYSNGYRFNISRYLKEIRISRAGQQLNSYYLDYEVEPEFARWKLKTLRYCTGDAVDGECLPPKSFKWEDRKNNGSDGTWASHGGTADFNFTGDFNGDGRLDVAAHDSGSRFNFCLSTGSDFNCTSVTLDIDAQKPLAVDFNGDGLTDVLGKKDGKWRICRANFVMKTDNTTEALTMQCGALQLYKSSNLDNLLVADIDANGRQEFIAKAESMICTENITGGGANLPLSCKLDVSLTGPAGQALDLSHIEHVTDINGDGASDFIVREPDDGDWFICTAQGPFVDFQPPSLQLPNYTCAQEANLPARQLSSEHNELFIADYNGDGMSDVAFYPNLQEDGRRADWWMFFSDGKKLLPATIWTAHAGGPTNNIVADFNGDGRADMAANRGNQNGWLIAYAAAGNFRRIGNDDFADISSDNAIVGDFDGDGRSEIIGILPNREKMVVRLSTALSAPYLSEVISEIPSDSPAINAQKTRLKLDYGYTSSTMATPPAYPNRFINGSVHVVTGASVPNAKSLAGSEVWDTVNYAYDQMVVNRRGLGILGFAVRAENDQRRKTVTRYEYYQDYPLIGMPRKVLSRTTKPDGTNVLNSVSTYDYSVEASGGACFVQDNSDTGICRPFRIHKTKDTTESYDYVTGTNISNIENTYNKSAGSVVVGAFDNYDYGKPKHITTVTTDKTNGLTWTKKTTSTFEHRLGADYQIGLLSTSKVEHSTSDASVPGTIIKESAFTYYPNGQLKEEIVEPNKTSLAERSAYLKTTRYYDPNYGFSSGSKSEGYDHNGVALPARETSINTEFVTGTNTNDIVRRETVTNSLNHVAVVEKSLEHGKTLYSIDVNGVPTETFYEDPWGNRPETKVTGGITSKVTGHYWVSGDSDARTNAVSKRVIRYTVTDTGSTAAPDQIDYFDANGQMVRTLSRGFAERDVLVDTTFDAFGRKTSQSQPHFRDNGSRAALWGYLDNTDRVMKETAIDGTVTDYTYSLLSMTRTSDERIHKEFRNASGNIYLVEEGSETSASKRTSITYRYDAAGRLVRTIDDNDNKTHISYDLRDRKIRQDDPDMGVWTYKYNSFGEMERQQDAKGQTRNTEFDQLGRVTKTWDGSGTEVRSWVTAKPGIGSLEKVTYQESGAVFQHYEKTFKYDSLGRVYNSTECLRDSNGDCENYKTQFEYDDQSRLKKTIMHGGVSIERSYQNNQLKKLTRGDGEVLWIARSVNALGQLETEQQGNGVVTRYGYDRTLLGSIKAEKLSSVITDQTYTYHLANAQLHVRTDNIFGMEETFGYDEHFRVSTLNKNYSGISDELIYGYDNLGNINSKPDVIETAGKTYVYGKGISVDGAGPHAIKSLGGRTFTYDANGNLENDGSRSVVWTAFNKPLSITNLSTGDETSFQYGTGSRRLKRIQSSEVAPGQQQITETTYLDGGSAAQIERVEKNGSIKFKYQYTLGNRVIAIDTVEEDKTTETTYLHHDHLGSVIAMTDKIGAVLERYSFDVWGKPRTLQIPNEISITSSLLHTKGFTGHEMLNGVGLVHMNGRIYDPALGRFMSADPHIQYAHNTQSFNRYSYVLNNPVGATDPTGYFTKWLRKMNQKHSWFRHLVTAASIAATAITAYATGGASLIFQGIVTGFVGAFTGSYLSGAGFRNSLSAGASGAVFGGLSAGVAAGIGGAFVAAPGFRGAALVRRLAHGVTQGALADVQGQSFRSGFAGGFVGEISPKIEKIGADVGLAALAGGVTAELGGGEFKDGARSAAFTRLFDNRLRDEPSRFELNDVEGLSENDVRVEGAGWRRNHEDLYHNMNELEINGESRNRKYNHTDGREVVFTTNEVGAAVLVTDHNAGTFNRDTNDGFVHFIYDIVPYYFEGTGQPNDNTTFIDRINGCQYVCSLD